MWNDRDLEEQYVPDHLINHHINIKPRENGLDHRHVISSSYDHMESNHLMSHHGDIIDPMLSHIGDQVENNIEKDGQVASIGDSPPPSPTPRVCVYLRNAGLNA